MIRTIAALLPMQRLAQRFIQSYDQYRSLTPAAADQRGGQGGRRAARCTPTLRARHRLRARLVRLRRAPDPDRARPADGDRGTSPRWSGPSGVGKSTIVDLLVGLYQPAAGADPGRRRRPARDRPRPRGGKSIGYVPQEVLLFHDTVRSNVTLYEEGVTDEAVLRALDGGRRRGIRGRAAAGARHRGRRARQPALGRPAPADLDRPRPAARAAPADPGRGHHRPRPAKPSGRSARMSAQLCEDTGLTVLAVSHQPAWQQAAHQVYRIEAGRAVPDRLPRPRVPRTWPILRGLRAAALVQA